jgi:acetylornithine deacetylase/succinyl-diaminopimelate desuccinylase-like protein
LATLFENLIIDTGETSLSLRAFALSILCLLLALPAVAQLSPADRQLAHAILKELIEINTTDSVGNVSTASEAMAKRLRSAGYSDSDIFIGGPNDRKKNLVVRLKGTGAKKPVLLIGHLDVVEAHREDWTSDPFELLEKDNYFYGRGVVDMKGSDAIYVLTMMRLKQEGYKPERDIILALTADEEGGKSNGVDWLLKNHRDLVDAEFSLNADGGGVVTEKGKPFVVAMGASEKLYADFELEVTNPGGHSSLPTPENAIYRLSDALVRLQNYKFPFELNDVTRAFFEQTSKVQTGQTAADMLAVTKTPPDQAAIDRLSKDPFYNSTMHTTCIATRLAAGHANNALPQRALANVNCRILPGHSREQVMNALIKVIDDSRVSVTYVSNGVKVTVLGEREKVAMPPVKLMPAVMDPLQKIAAEMWPGAPVVPTMGTGATDGVYTNPAGIPTYGVCGLAIDVDDDRSHGRDERLPVESYYTGAEFYYRYLKAVAGGK